MATSADLAPLHPEKVLRVQAEFTRQHAGEHERLLAALIEACEFCDLPDNRLVLSQMLAQPRYVNAPAECVMGIPACATGPGRGTRSVNPNMFHKHNANEPSDDKAAWLIEQLYESLDSAGAQLWTGGRVPLLRNVFRRDLFQRAIIVRSDHLQALKAEAESYQARMNRLA